MYSILCALLRRSAFITGVVGWLCFAPPHADASPLDLTETSPGDVTTFAIDVEYSHNTGVLTATGSGDDFYSVLDDNGYFNAGAFSVSATLNPTTGALVSGTVSISGTEYYTVDDSPLVYSGVLLTGNLTAFGFPNPTSATNDPLEFTFNVTGGQLTALGKPYHNAATGGMILHMITNTSYFTDGWPSTNFSSNIDNTSADTFPVNLVAAPEPATFVLLGLGLIPLAWRLRRRDHHSA